MTAGQPVRDRRVWEESEERRHAVELIGTAGEGITVYVATLPATDCGLVVPDDVGLDDGPVTCPECLWGWLDPVLYLAAEREAVGT